MTGSVAFTGPGALAPPGRSTTDGASEPVLSVRNQGPAIPASDLPMIFDPFRQLGPERVESRDRRSAGLGLYIAKAIVTAHQGTIDVTSAGGETTFTVCLPRAGQAK